MQRPTSHAVRSPAPGPGRCRPPLDAPSGAGRAGSARTLLAGAALVLWAGAACAGPGAPTPEPVTHVTQEEWRALATPRPTPLPGAPRIALGSIEPTAARPWQLDTSLSPSLALGELVAAGLLERDDVTFVERRRFSAAVAAERLGQQRPGAPPAGTSPAPELIFSAMWVTLGAGPGSLEMRLTDSESGAVVDSWRAEAPAGVRPVRLARLIVAGLLERLADGGRLPGGGSAAASAPAGSPPRGVDAGALDRFLLGLTAEEAWDWERARAGYQAALAADPSFVEAAAALARAARLRMGGTLGASQ